MNGNSYVPAALLVYLSVHFLLHVAKSSKVKKQGPRLVFDATLPIRVVMIIATAGFASGAAYVAFAVKGGLVGAVIFAGLAVIGTLAYPSTISITRDGVQEHTWWGKSTYIAWHDVERIEYHQGPATTLVVSRDGKKIAHAGFHSDSESFRAECLSHTHLKLSVSRL
jgi:hypothetical protein